MNKVKRGWKLPSAPTGFDTPVAFYHSDGDIILDWTRKQRDFSSEFPHLDGQGIIEWPFKLGIVPSREDWDKIGIMQLT